MKDAADRMLKILKKHGSCCICVHHNADPDAIGSAIALSIVLKKLEIPNEVVAPQSLSAQSKALLRKYPYPVRKKCEKKHSLIIVVDTASMEQLRGMEFEGKSIIVIDHHKHGSLRDKAELAIIRPEVMATSIIVYELIKAIGITLEAQLQFFLAVGIVADTGFLRNATNTELRVLAELLQDVELQDVMSAIHLSKDRSERIAMLKSMGRMQVYDANGMLVSISEIGSFEASCALAILKAGADIAIVANIGRDEIRISCRANEEASKSLKLVGLFKQLEPVLNGESGGHETAISLNGRAPEKWDEAKNLILKELEVRTKKKIKRIV